MSDVDVQPDEEVEEIVEYPEGGGVTSDHQSGDPNQGSDPA